MRQVILTRYSESESTFDWTKDFVDNPEVVIYNKGNTPFGLPARWSRPNVGRDLESQLWEDIYVSPSQIRRPNVGRDLESQLWHILTNYDNLADELLMLPPHFKDHLDWPRWAPGVAANNDKLPDSILNHDYDGSVLQFMNVYHTECYNPNGVELPGVITVNYWQMLIDLTQPHLDGLNSLVKTNYNVNDSICWTFSPGIAYSVPKSMILNKSKAWWQRCYDFYMSEPPPHCHAYFFERCYCDLWNYSEY